MFNVDMRLHNNLLSRLSKRIVTVIITTVMAVSMLIPATASASGRIEGQFKIAQDGYVWECHWAERNPDHDVAYCHRVENGVSAHNGMFKLNISRSEAHDYEIEPVWSPRSPSLEETARFKGALIRARLQIPDRTSAALAANPGWAKASGPYGSSSPGIAGAGAWGLAGQPRKVYVLLNADSNVPWPVNVVVAWSDGTVSSHTVQLGGSGSYIYHYYPPNYTDTDMVYFTQAWIPGYAQDEYLRWPVVVPAEGPPPECNPNDGSDCSG